MTQRLYEIDSYCREFKATVESCEEKDGFYYVVLDKTAFFPEGGGQAPDKGTLNGASVLDVQIKDDIIYHKTETPFNAGDEVEGKLDWVLRFSRMQSHCGEHIVSGVVHAMFGYANTGFHMSEAVMTVDFSGPLSQKDIDEIELRSNKAIYENAPITTFCPPLEELVTLQYRSKLEPKEGTRLVKIGDIDCCACCAPHPGRTGEVGVIKIISFHPHKQGTRLEMLAGIHAYEDYCALHTSNKGIMGLLSASRDCTKDAVSKQKELVDSLKYENQKMSKELALNNLKTVEVNNSVYSVGENMNYEELIFCANSVLERGFEICILLSKTDGDNYIYVISSKTEDIRETVKKLNLAFNGKGGGRPNYAQGRITAENEAELKTALEEIILNK